MKYILISFLFISTISLAQNSPPRDIRIDRDTLYHDTVRCKFIVANTDTSIKVIHGYMARELFHAGSHVDKNCWVFMHYLDDKKKAIKKSILKIEEQSQFPEHEETAPFMTY